MAILFNEQSREFHIQGRNTSYIFSVLSNGYLGQLYYGKKIKHRDSFSHLMQYPRRMVAVPSPNEPGNPKFSMELTKQEFPHFGGMDCRQPAIKIKQQNGSRLTEFKYQSHVIRSGKSKLAGLPATYVESDGEATTLDITLYDDVIGATLILTYTVFEAFDVITRSSRLVNSGSQPLLIERFMSCSVDFPDKDFDFMHLSGAWVRERHVKERKLEHGIQSIHSIRGGSSHVHNPFMALKRFDCTEHSGEVYGFSLVYSGNFLAQAEVDQFDVTRAMMGIHPDTFNWNVHPGESFQAPETVMVFSDKGLNGMSQKYHALYTARLAKGMWRQKERPVIINNWEATYFKFNEDKLVTLARQAKELGIELFVLDDGWFGKRNNDTTSLGDWFEDETKLPHGLKGLGEKINDLGMQFGLWVEPEMINRESRLYEKHPEWLLQIPNRISSPGRFQFVLDYTNDAVIDYLYERLHDILTNAPISYVKWDMNRGMSEVGSTHLAADQQMEVYHRYILGLYKLMDRITTAFPEVLFESCASGGGRFDPGMLYYMPQTWTSDDTDAVERLKIQYGTSMVYPINAMGAHVSAVPNHQVMRMTSLKTRAETAFFGTFGYELDVTQMTDAEKEEVKAQIAFYKLHRSTFQFGTFYRLKNPFKGNETAWMVVSADQKDAVVGYYQVLAKPNPGFKGLRLKGLNPEFEYTIAGRDGVYYGDELENIGIKLDPEFDATSIEGMHDSQDFKSTIFVLQCR